MDNLRGRLTEKTEFLGMTSPKVMGEAHLDSTLDARKGVLLPMTGMVLTQLSPF